MAYQLSLGLRFHSQKIARDYQCLFEKDTRPLFEDEVSSDCLSAFEVISDFEYPSFTELDNDTLMLFWYEVDDLKFDDFYPVIQLEGVEFLAAYEIPDDPMSWDEDVDNGWFWVRAGKNIQQMSFDQGKKMIPAYLEKLKVPV